MGRVQPRRSRGSRLLPERLKGVGDEGVSAPRPWVPACAGKTEGGSGMTGVIGAR